ncbi:MAG: diguanylate cyclase [Azoarcus sp.]|jgi:diguanylate cyclase (GGDEF)-like protein|nr:diguanylate cyclase [Azoarcus sp.]
MGDQQTVANMTTQPKILIVDDSRMVRASLTKQLRNRFQIREEADGEAGWEALLVDPSLQCVLTDLGMPRLDGFGLLERIRSSKVPRISELPVIIISGDEDDVARERALKLGANDFASKGAGCAELTARLESLMHLVEARHELAVSRNALAAQTPVDPVSGLATPSYLNLNAEQQLSLARRHMGDISVMVVDIDHYDQLVEWHGHHVAELITRKLSKILATKVRREDTVTQISGARFAVLSPSTELLGCCAFAMRLQRAMEKLVMTYRDERIRITMTIGVSSSLNDNVQGVEELIEIAAQRVQQGVDAGGNRIVGDQGEVDYAVIELYLKQTVSIDHVLLQLKIGTANEAMERIPDIARALLPLLELLEERLKCGLSLAKLKDYVRQTSAGDKLRGAAERLNVG